MTAVQAYTTGCRSSPGAGGGERTVLRSWKEHGMHRVTGVAGRSWDQSLQSPRGKSCSRRRRVGKAWGRAGPQPGERSGQRCPAPRSAAGVPVGSDGRLPRAAPCWARGRPASLPPARGCGHPGTTASFCPGGTGLPEPAAVRCTCLMAPPQEAPVRLSPGPSVGRAPPDVVPRPLCGPRTP